MYSMDKIQGVSYLEFYLANKYAQHSEESFSQRAKRIISIIETAEEGESGAVGSAPQPEELNSFSSSPQAASGRREFLFCSHASKLFISSKEK